MMVNQCLHCNAEMAEGDQVCGVCKASANAYRPFDLSLGGTKPAPEPGEPMKFRKYTPYTQDAKQYGKWRFYDPTRVKTLSEAMNSLGRMLMDTIRDRGQPNGLQWIVHDLKEQWPILPNEIENVKRPAGYTCTVGFKAYFEEEV